MKKIKKEDYWILYVFCCDYHRGQWSRGYRLLCKLQKYGFDISDRELNPRENDIYRHLERNYRNKV